MLFAAVAGPRFLLLRFLYIGHVIVGALESSAPTAASNCCFTCAPPSSHARDTDQLCVKVVRNIEFTF